MISPVMRSLSFRSESQRILFAVFLGLLPASMVMAAHSSRQVEASGPTVALAGTQLRMAGALDRSHVVLHFDRALKPGPAAIPSNFDIPGLEVLSSEREGQLSWSTATRIVLEVEPMEDIDYQVTVAGIEGRFGTPMDPEHSSFEFRGFDDRTTRFSQLRMLGDSVGYGMWPILTDPAYTIFNLATGIIQARQEGTGVTMEAVNLSVPGFTTVQVLEQTLWDAIDANPDVVIVEIGGNDFGLVDFDRFKDNLYTIYATLSTELPHAQIIGADIYDAVLNAFPFGGDGHTVPEWVDAIHEIAAIFEVPVVDIYGSFLGHTAPGGWYMSVDGLHPNAPGHALAACAGFEVMRRLPHRPAPPWIQEAGPGWVVLDTWVWQGDVVTEFFRFEIDGEEVAEVAIDELPLRVTGLSPDEDHVLRVRSIVPASEDGSQIASGWSDPVEFKALDDAWIH